MTSEDVAAILASLKRVGIPVWLDGGWCVEALVGRPLRQHDDLDIGIERQFEPGLLDWASVHGYRGRPNDPDIAAYVLRDSEGSTIDVHVVEYGEDGEPVWGIQYPAGSFAGSGSLAGTIVACVAPQLMFKFKTAYPPATKDLIDVRALADRFGFPIPESHAGQV